MLNWLLVAFPIAALSGWYFGRSGQKKSTTNQTVSRDYLKGLNYLLDEQPDKAVDIFIRMLEVNSETVDTHLALGNLFRRRGEVDRAIRIHQNLISILHLDKTHRIQALLALGRDYMLAGVFDRAKRLFQQVIDTGEYVIESMMYLLDIYQQEKDWEQAIIIANRLQAATGQPMRNEIAHYYCELAIDAKTKISSEQAMRFLKRGLAIDRNSVRASLLHAEWECEAGHYKAAVKQYRRIKQQDVNFLSEALPGLLFCYKKLNNETELIHFLQECLAVEPKVSIILFLSERLQHAYGVQVAVDFIIEQLKKHASLRGLYRLIELQTSLTDEKSKESMKLLAEFTQRLLQDKPTYLCQNCGYSGRVLHWQCPTCKLWGTIKPIHGLAGVS